MKTERRHQLEHNTLAYYLEKIVLATKEYHNTILIVLVGLIVVAVVWSIGRNITHMSDGKAWNEIYRLSGGGILPADRVLNGFQAPVMVGGDQYFRPEDKSADADAEKLLDFGKKHLSKPVGVVALLGSGNQSLEAAAQILRSRSPLAEEAAALLTEGMETLALAEKNAKGDYKLQAQLALARGYELQATLGDTKENLEKALEKYKAVAGSGSPLATMAKATVATLENPNTEALYVTLAQRIAGAADAQPATGGDLMDFTTLPEVEGTTADLPDEIDYSAMMEMMKSLEAAQPAEDAAEAPSAETPAE